MGRGVINQVWVGGHQPTMGRGVINQVWVGGSSTNYGGVTIRQQWGIGVSIFPLVCTGTQNPQNYFSNTYVLPSVNRTAGPIIQSLWSESSVCHPRSRLSVTRHFYRTSQTGKSSSLLVSPCWDQTTSHPVSLYRLIVQNNENTNKTWKSSTWLFLWGWFYVIKMGID